MQCRLISPWRRVADWTWSRSAAGKASIWSWLREALVMLIGAALCWTGAMAQPHRDTPRNASGATGVEKARVQANASSSGARKTTAQRPSKPAAARSKVRARPKATTVRAQGARKAAPVRQVRKRSAPMVVSRAPVERLSYGQMAGLHRTEDPLDLNSSVALVIDQDTDQVLFSKNPQAVLPIASITKLMTALVVLESGQSLDEILTISQDDVDTEKGSRSRLHVGTRLTRGQMLHLALMSSENRAAHALGRHFPGGLPAFVRVMNDKALALGMGSTRFVEPTGLSSANQSSALDLSVLVRATARHELIRELSTSLDTQVPVGRRHLEFRNTNSLVRQPDWEIGLQKTGYISEAGRCVVMQAQLAGRHVIMVLLDAAGRHSRIGDAERLRRWLSSAPTRSVQPS